MKKRSTFFSKYTLDSIKKTTADSVLKLETLEKAEKWMLQSDDELWDAIFGWELKRSHMALSYGWCPSCKETVGLYDWFTDPFNKPWKVRCPHCGEYFPKNDFGKYYKSGLDEHHVFHYELADRSLLYNEDAPDPKDGKHLFGVDDGKGYYEGKDRWVFIACYLVAGLWSKHIYAGINTLSLAYILTGDRRYARKCGILLDRLADLYPEYDFFEQGVMYEEERTSRGYIAYWCSSAIQLRTMLIAYDSVFETLRDDEGFAAYVIEKSKRYKTPYLKNNFSDIQRNIEERIFSDALAHKWKIAANYPWTEMYTAVLKLVLTDWPEKPDDMAEGVYKVLWWTAIEELNQIMDLAIKADGLSGEKAFAGYNAIAPEATIRLISLYNVYDRDMLTKTIKTHPKLIQGIRFFMNAWLLNKYYPGCGDCGYLNEPNPYIPFTPGYVLYGYDSSPGEALFTFEGFLWKLYKITGDVDFVRYMYNAKNFDIKRCFTTDITLDEPSEVIQEKIIALMKEKGSDLNQISMDHKDWKLAILHSGKGEDRRCAYIDYDSGGAHGHNDGMNIGIFAKGFNFLPDLGGPPHDWPGGWSSKYYYWYRSAASHNTVIVDGKEHRDYCYVQRDINGGQGLISESGRTVLWGIGRNVKVTAVDDPLIPGGGVKRFERMIAMVDLSDRECCFIDIFRVKGGREHVKLTRAAVCTLKLENLEMVRYTPDEDPYGMGLIRDRNEKENFHYNVDPDYKFIDDMMIDTDPPDNWSAEWTYTDRFKCFAPQSEKKTSLRYRDLTENIQVISYKAFFDSHSAMIACRPEEIRGTKDHPVEMLPAVAVVRKGEDDLSSVFIGVYEPCVGEACIDGIDRSHVMDSEGNDYKDAASAVIRTKNGSADLFMAADMQDRRTMVQQEWNVETDAAVLHIRKEADGRHSITMMKGSYFKCGGYEVRLKTQTDLYEIDVDSIPGT